MGSIQSWRHHHLTNVLIVSCFGYKRLLNALYDVWSSVWPVVDVVVCVIRKQEPSKNNLGTILLQCQRKYLLASYTIQASTGHSICQNGRGEDGLGVFSQLQSMLVATEFYTLDF